MDATRTHKYLLYLLYLLAHPPTCLLAYPPNYSPTCLCAYLSALPTCLLDYLPIRLHVDVQVCT